MKSVREWAAITRERGTEEYMEVRWVYIERWREKQEKKIWKRGGLFSLITTANVKGKEEAFFGYILFEIDMAGGGGAYRDGIMKGNVVD